MNRKISILQQNFSIYLLQNYRQVNSYNNEMSLFGN